MNSTCLTNPPGSSNAFICKLANIGKFAAQVFACHSKACHSKKISDALDERIAGKINQILAADDKLAGKTGSTAPPSSPFVEMSADSQPLVVIVAGSDSDMPHLETLKKELAKFKLDSEIRICSAHKQRARLEAVINEYNKYTCPVMMVGCAGGTDAWSCTALYYFILFPT